MATASRQPSKSGRLLQTSSTQSVNVFSTASASKYFRSLCNVARQGVFLCVKPSVLARSLARSGWVRAQVAMDVYPLCPVIRTIMLSPRIDFNALSRNSLTEMINA